MIRIICAGNRGTNFDAVGPKVFDRLRQLDLPAGVEVVFGGLAGLDLLRFIEGCERVIFVDRLVGWSAAGSVQVLEPADLEHAENDDYGHSGGLGYLLRTLPHLGLHPCPRWTLVGLEGDSQPEGVALLVEKLLGLIPKEVAG